MLRKSAAHDDRTEQQLRDHYIVERELADKLRSAPREERSSLYSSLYEELFRRVPDHPQLVRKVSAEQQARAIQHKLKLLAKVLDKNKSFLEIGAGDCALSFKVANTVREVYAVDVSMSITSASDVPENFKLILSDGCSIPVPDNSIDVAYSNQLMEHLHSDDAYDQLRNILRALSPGGVYVCITPNRLNGPHDISMHFDNVATGFHMREYSIGELSRLFKNVGFGKIAMYVGAKGKYIKIPVFPLIFCESVLERLPAKLRQNLANTKLMRALLAIRLAGCKTR